LLLAIAAGAGTWNYRRNLAFEQQTRPYLGYSTGELDALIAAYEQELARARRDYRAGAGLPVRVQEGRLLGDQILEFERVQRLSQNRRELGSRVVEREAALERLREERARRDPAEHPVLRLLRLAFVYRRS
jgi:hypothetical protein